MAATFALHGWLRTS
ncbi:trp operon leader peptide [Salmonella enterica]